MPKLNLAITGFRQCRRGTLRGFCDVRVNEMHMRIFDITVHQHASGKRWAGLPARPMVDRDGAARLDSDGRPGYSPIITFSRSEVREAFSRAVITALLEFKPDAFNELDQLVSEKSSPQKPET